MAALDRIRLTGQLTRGPRHTAGSLSFRGRTTTSPVIERELTTGPERGYGVDQEYLVVRFDAGGRVRSVALETD